MKKAKNNIIAGVVLLAVFACFTILVKNVDVRPVGPDNSLVGFSGINKAFFDAFGQSSICYYLTEIYGYISILVMATFAGTGLLQLVKRKSLKKVDGEIWCLGGFYVIVLAIYLFFEKCIINFRPVILDAEEGLEASYPSSHVMLICTTMISAAMVVSRMAPRYHVSTYKWIVLACDIIAITAVVGRLLSGVHWLTDIIAGVELSAALLFLFKGVLLLTCKEKTKKENGQ